MRVDDPVMVGVAQSISHSVAAARSLLRESGWGDQGAGAAYTSEFAEKRER